MFFNGILTSQDSNASQKYKKERICIDSLVYCKAWNYLTLEYPSIILKISRQKNMPNGGQLSGTVERQNVYLSQILLRIGRVQYNTFCLNKDFWFKRVLHFLLFICSAKNTFTKKVINNQPEAFSLLCPHKRSASETPPQVNSSAREQTTPFQVKPQQPESHPFYLTLIIALFSRATKTNVYDYKSYTMVVVAARLQTRN